MDLSFFIIGFIIFSFYVYFLIWNIFNSTKKQREENNYRQEVDNVDMDGMGNFNRFGK
jgi:large-conductance mechanosensitive channel|tara:strand:+ start:2651 stop:2824 length:174 start_codon:yes stop_codon:yes gene_type:complete